MLFPSVRLLVVHPQQTRSRTLTVAVTHPGTNPHNCSLTSSSDHTTIYPLGHWYSSKSNWLDTYRFSDSQLPSVVGENKILLKEEGLSEESNIGDVICQSMAAVYENTTISFTNNRGIRSTLQVGNLTYEDILYVLPFDNTVDLVTMKGSGIITCLENVAFNIDPTDVDEYTGFGYQLSGLKVTIGRWKMTSIVLS